MNHPTAIYGTWYNVVGSLSPEQDVMDFAGGFDVDYDMEAIATDYRVAITAILPGSMILAGDQFIAMVLDAAISENWSSEVNEAIQEIDLTPFFEAHTNEEESSDG